MYRIVLSPRISSLFWNSQAIRFERGSAPFVILKMGVDKIMYHRYWFTFKGFDRPTPLNLGCGVTAESEHAATELIRASVFEGAVFEVQRIIANVSIAELDQGHVVPNMGNPLVRGIWFPLGYSQY